jgi:hypothetical protein
MVGRPFSGNDEVRCRSVEALGCCGDTNDALQVRQGPEQIKFPLLHGLLTVTQTYVSVDALRLPFRPSLPEGFAT